MSTEKEPELYVTASIECTVIYKMPTRWSSDETMGNIQKRAKREAIKQVNQALQAERVPGKGIIKGEPTVYISVCEVKEK